MNELLSIARKLAQAANRWPISEDRRLDVLRVAARIRMDAMSDLEIELLIFKQLASGARYIDDIVDALGLSRREAADVLERMWMQGTLEKGTEQINGRGRPRTVFTLSGDLSFKEKNDSFEPLDSAHNG